MSTITPIVMPKWGLEMREGTVVAWRVDEGARMAEQQRAASDRDDVVVEYTGVDRRGILLREHRARGVEPMSPRHRLAGLAGLARHVARRRDARGFDVAGHAYAAQAPVAFGLCAPLGVSRASMRRADEPV